jgi:spore photoproduct lyase
MALDRLTGLSRRLINYFARRKNAVLELKTKSAYIENLRNIDHGGNTIIAWSLNSSEIMEKEEIRTSSLEERLDAALSCASLGYHLAFHFDPVICHNGWKDDYFKTIDRLFKKVPADSIRWISIGAFRFIPHLKAIGLRRFPQSTIYFNEFVEGLDNKQRYFRTLRVNIYKEIYQRLKEYAAADTCIYFCMESDEVWQEVMGYSPGEKGGLVRMLDASVTT